MKSVKKRINSRVTLSYVNTGEKFKSCVFSVNFILPLSFEKSHLYSLIPSVLNSGTVNYPTRAALCVRFQELYGASIATRIVKRGSRQLISIEADLLSDRYSEYGNLLRVVEMLYELIFNPLLTDGVFNRDTVELEKNAVIEKIRAEKNNKTSYSVQRCMSLMLENETVGIRLDGDEDSVAKITPESLYSAYLDMINSSQIELCYAGDADIDDVLPLATYIDNAFPEGKAPIFEKIGERTPREVRSFYEDVDMVQGRLAIGFRCVGDAFDNDAARNMFMGILSSSPMSKLFVNIREKHSLCYYCRAKAEFDGRIMVIYSGLENSQFEFAKDAILKEIEDIANGIISDGEYEAAKKSLLSSIDYITDSPVDIARWEMDRAMLGRDSDLDALKVEIENLDKTAVLECARGVFVDTVLYLNGKSEIEDGDFDE